MGSEHATAIRICESVYQSVINPNQPGGIEWQLDAALGDARQILEALAAQAKDPSILFVGQLLESSMREKYAALPAESKRVLA